MLPRQYFGDEGVPLLASLAKLLRRIERYVDPPGDFPFGRSERDVGLFENHRVGDDQQIYVTRRRVGTFGGGPIDDCKLNAFSQTCEGGLYRLSEANCFQHNSA